MFLYPDSINKLSQKLLFILHLLLSDYMFMSFSVFLASVFMFSYRSDLDPYFDLSQDQTIVRKTGKHCHPQRVPLFYHSAFWHTLIAIPAATFY